MSRGTEKMRKAQKLKRNAVQCLVCGYIIESTHRHDNKRCKCGNAMVDGGLEYLRYGTRDGWETVRTLFEYEECDE